MKGRSTGRALGFSAFPFVFQMWDDWLYRAKCAQGPVKGRDWDTFFPEHNSVERRHISDRGRFSSTERRAKAICAGCPVRAQCLDLMYSTGEQEGIWGGTTERERVDHRHLPDCKGCKQKVTVHETQNNEGDTIKYWRIHGCKPIEDRVRDLLAEMDDQADRNGFRTKEEGAA